MRHLSILILFACNSQFGRIWVARKLHKIRSSEAGSNDIEAEDIESFMKTSTGADTFRGEWRHDKSVSAAYWDIRGRGIVSTSYDDTIRRKSSFAPFLHVDREIICSVGH